MMGKRVNYASRLVISPDPNIEINEIGIPPVFAKKLTYPEPVTAHNVAGLQEAVVNGHDSWPGATDVQNEDGSIVSLAVFDEAGRKRIASQLSTPSLQKNGNLRCVSSIEERGLWANEPSADSSQTVLHGPHGLNEN